MVIHLGTKQLETNRLILRKFTLDDAEDMFKNWVNDKEVTKYLSWPPHGRIEVTKNVLLSWIENYKNRDVYNWGIVAKSIGELIGSISVVKFSCQSLVCEIGYCISKAYWNKGITTEAVKTVIKFLIREVGVERVHAFHNIHNVASGKVMQKAGMIFESKLRKYHLNRDGVLEDVNIYSKIDTDK